MGKGMLTAHPLPATNDLMISCKPRHLSHFPGKGGSALSPPLPHPSPPKRLPHANFHFIWELKCKLASQSLLPQFCRSLEGCLFVYLFFF